MCYHLSIRFVPCLSSGWRSTKSTLINRGTRNRPPRGLPPVGAFNAICFPWLLGAHDTNCPIFPRTPSDARVCGPWCKTIRTGLTGYLQKKAKTGKWQKRWFETNAHYLTYYKVIQNRNPSTLPPVPHSFGVSSQRMNFPPLSGVFLALLTPPAAFVPTLCPSSTWRRDVIWVMWCTACAVEEDGETPGGSQPAAGGGDPIG